MAETETVEPDQARTLTLTQKRFRWTFVLLLPVLSQALIYLTFCQLVDTASIDRFVACVAFAGAAGDAPKCAIPAAAEELNAAKKRQAIEAAEHAKAAETAKTAKDDPPSKQAASDTAVRIDLAGSSAAVRIAALVALAFAFHQLARKGSSPVSYGLIGLGLAIAGGVGAALYELAGVGRYVTGSRLLDPLLASSDLTWIFVPNLVLGYAAVGALLAALCAVVDDATGDRAERLARLQVILVLSGALFSAGVAVEGDLIDIALLYNPAVAAQADVKAAFDSLKAFSGFAGAAFVTLAVGAAYACLQQEKTATPARIGKALALQDGNGTELQLVSAIFNILFALSPVIAAAFKSTGVALPAP